MPAQSSDLAWATQVRRVIKGSRRTGEAGAARGRGTRGADFAQGRGVGGASRRGAGREALISRRGGALYSHGGAGRGALGSAPQRSGQP